MPFEKIIAKVQTIVADVLEIDSDDIDLNHSLVDDLGIESVDLVDISAKIETAFQIDIAPGELWNMTGLFDNNGIDSKGRLTSRGVQSLSRCFGKHFKPIKAGTPIADIFSLITVRTIVDYLIDKTQQRTAQ
jgi:acyl carrier protein